MKRHTISALAVSILSLVVAFLAGWEFLAQREEEPIVAGPGVTGLRSLSAYFPGLKRTPGDTTVYVLKGAEAGGSLLVLGGTHPNEPSGYLAAVVLIENARLAKGTLYVIPRANRSGFSHNDPQEGAPQRFSVKTAQGERTFRFGSRATNPVHQWPDPDVYIHAASGQTLSGSETRNLNRGYPGRPDGSFTERVCFGLAELIRKEKIDLTIDLHEASPEYPVINAIVAHPRAMPLASQVVLGLEMEDISIKLEPSPAKLRGLSHRELGDYTQTMAVLMETANPAQGRLRGRTDANLVLTGKDTYYVRARQLGRLFVPFDEKGHPLEERVGRHLAGIIEFTRALGKVFPDKPVEIEGLPAYNDLLSSGLGAFLLPVK